MKKTLSFMLCILIALSSSYILVAGASVASPYDNSQYFEYGDYSIHYRVTPAKGEFKGRIMMLHGFVCSTYSWRNMVTELTEKGYECVCVDLPNFGYSTRENKDTEIVEREQLVIELMKSISDTDDWIIAGHSMGGGVAINIAERIPVEALLLYCPCPQNSFPSFAEGICTSVPMEKFMNFFFNYGTRLSLLVKLVIYAATMDWKFAMDYDVTGVTDAVQYDGFGAGMCEMMYNVIPTDMENVSSIKCPVLLCQADKDIILTSSIKQSVNDAFPNAETYTVIGGGHQCIENRAQELGNVTVDFLSSVA